VGGVGQQSKGKKQASKPKRGGGCTKKGDVSSGEKKPECQSRNTKVNKARKTAKPRSKTGKKKEGGEKTWAKKTKWEKKKNKSSSKVWDVTGNFMGVGLCSSGGGNKKNDTNNLGGPSFQPKTLKWGEDGRWRPQITVLIIHEKKTPLNRRNK